MSNSKIPVVASFELKAIPRNNCQKDYLLGYHAISTAPINVEGYEEERNEYNLDYESTQTIKIDPEIAPKNEKILDEIGSFLRNSSNPEITISVHGYATPWKEVETLNQKIFAYGKKNCPKDGKQVLIGYRWPAENPLQDVPADSERYTTANLQRKIKYAFQSLPTLAVQWLGSGVLLGIVANTFYVWNTFILNALPSWERYTLLMAVILLLLGFGAAWWLIQYSGSQRVLGNFLFWLLGWGIAIALVLLKNPNSILEFSSLVLINLLLAFLGFTVLTLILLRQVTYLRDQYRAENYGVVDLMELLRQIEKHYPKGTHGTEEPKRIKVNFIAHSLGCFLVVDLVRVLSDIFDEEAIAHAPDSEIGNIFSLGRLVLVAPDIPIEFVLPGRANFLKSALRRFEEAYVFSNEGDLALRLASTVANYIRFPNRTRLRGYKLGNLTIKPEFEHGKIRYGILNLNREQTEILSGNLACYLEIRASQDRLELSKINSHPEEYNATNCFAYFDCTHYQDNPLIWSEEKQDLQPCKNLSLRLSNAKENQNSLGFWDYLPLTINYITQNGRKNWIDTHGGYFSGNCTQQMIYGLAFLGLNAFTNNLSAESPLGALDNFCRERKIIGLLSSDRTPQL